MDIRQIQIRDFESITSLASQLGSRIEEEIVQQQIEDIMQNPDHDAFVAEKNNVIIGYIHCFKAIRLTTKPFIEICGLVINEKERGNGIGNPWLNISKNYTPKNMLFGCVVIQKEN